MAKTQFIASTLIVDDDRTALMFSNAIISNLGCTVETAMNADDALELHQEKKFDLILMDIEMPDCNGYDATVKLRNLEKECRQKASIVIALSGHIDSRDVLQKCLSSGMNDCLTKPLQPDAAVSRLRKWNIPLKKVLNTHPTLRKSE